jgi:hypothetical protein
MYDITAVITRLSAFRSARSPHPPVHGLLSGALQPNLTLRQHVAPYTNSTYTSVKHTALDQTLTIFNMAPKKRPIETIDLTDDSSFYSPQSNAHVSSPRGSTQASSSQGYAHSSQSSPYGRAAKQARTAHASGVSHDPVYVDDDEEEDLSATQGVSEQEYSWTLYGVLHGKIVGCRYYSGYATVGEMVVVKREPSNQYDSMFFLLG